MKIFQTNIPYLADYLCATDEPVNDYDLSNQIIGASAVLPFESYDQMIMLPILEHDNIEVSQKTLSKNFMLF
jgi:hypothetical protein